MGFSEAAAKSLILYYIQRTALTPLIILYSFNVLSDYKIASAHSHYTQ